MTRRAGQIPVAYHSTSSLRAQTLYRTVSGTKYSKAIKLLYRVENPELVQLFGGNTNRLERELERKFIFSENIGISGDVAAGKEQTFGTLASTSISFELGPGPENQL